MFHYFERFIVMSGIFFFLAVILYIASFVCSLIILIHAFNTEMVKGLLCLCLPFYVLYYAFTQYYSENKGLILGVWLGGNVLASILIMAAGMP